MSPRPGTGTGSCAPARPGFARGTGRRKMMMPRSVRTAAMGPTFRRRQSAPRMHPDAARARLAAPGAAQPRAGDAIAVAGGRPASVRLELLRDDRVAAALVHVDAPEVARFRSGLPAFLAYRSPRSGS